MMCAKWFLSLVLISLLATLAGCGSKGATSSAAELEKAFPAAPTAGIATPSGPIQTHVTAAATAIKDKHYEAAITELDSLRAQRGLTPDQYLTLNKISGEVMQKLVALAEKGDAQAKAALDRLKQERDKR
jgi:hypothetical protein